MNDIDIAKNLLTNEQLALVVVKEGDVLYKSKDGGITPLYTAVKEMRFKLKGASVADKVIGKAAAMLCSHASIHELYTNIISDKAIEVLDKTDIKRSYELSVPYIKNRNNTGLCPIENLALDVDDIELLLTKIDNLLININL